jgi:Protein of unknown function (DUF1761)
MLVDLHGLNAWAILAAAVAGFVIGGIWYAPPVLGDKWMAALGKTKEQLGSPALPMVVQAAVSLVIACVLAVVVSRFGAVTWAEGAAIGFALSVGLIGATILSDSMFSGPNAKLYLIQVGYRVVSITIMGAILGAWR